MSARAVGITVFSAVWIAAQVAVPLATLRGRLEDGRIRPFGWQMFSALAPIDEYELVVPDGTLVPVRVADHAYVVRIDVPYERGFPEYLCRLSPDARGVVRHISGAGPFVYHACR